MTKKTPKEATPVAVTAPAPIVQSTKKKIVSLPCALKYFFRYALTAWGYCRAELPLFFAESDRFIEEFIDDQVTLIETVEKLPDNETRLSEASAAEAALKGWRQQVGSFAKRLRTAINYTFKDAAIAAIERKNAGIEKFKIPSNEDWGSVSDFITTATNYLLNKGADLVAAKAINANFEPEFKSTGTDFNKAWADFIAKEKLAVNGTKVLNDGLKAIQVELNPMLEMGKQVFEFDATKRKMFTTVDLLNEVRGHHPAGIGGFVRMDEQPQVGIRVEIAGMEGKFAITDQRGKYEISVAAGTYDIQFTSEHTQPLTILKRKVKAGVKGRLNVELMPKPVEVANVVTEPATPPVLNTSLSNAVSEMMERASGNGAMA